MATPFDSITQTLQGLIAQENSPAYQQGKINNQLTFQSVQQQQMLQSYLGSADLTNTNPSEILRTITAITGNQNMVPALVKQLAEENAFAQQQRQLQALQKDLQTGVDEIVNDGQATEGEMLQLRSNLVSKYPQAADVIDKALPNALSESTALIEQRKTAAEENKAQARERDATVLLRQAQARKADRVGTTTKETDPLKQIDSQIRDIEKERSTLVNKIQGREVGKGEGDTQKENEAKAEELRAEIQSLLRTKKVIRGQEAPENLEELDQLVVDGLLTPEQAVKIARKYKTKESVKIGPRLPSGEF